MEERKKRKRAEREREKKGTNCWINTEKSQRGSSFVCKKLGQEKKVRRTKASPPGALMVLVSVP